MQFQKLDRVFKVIRLFILFFILEVFGQVKNTLWAKPEGTCQFGDKPLDLNIQSSPLPTRALGPVFVALLPSPPLRLSLAASLWLIPAPAPQATCP